MSTATPAPDDVDLPADNEGLSAALLEQIALMESAGKTHMSVRLSTMRKLVTVLKGTRT